MASNKEAKHPQSGRNRTIILTIIGLALLGCALIATVLSYQNLRQSLEVEREAYINELTVQTDSKVNFTYQKYTKLAEVYATFLSGQNFDSFAQCMHKLTAMEQEDGDELFLVSDTGDFYATSGTRYTFDDKIFLQALVSDAKPIAEFERFSTSQEYWMFGCPVSNLSIGDINIAAAVSAGNRESFRNELTVAMFEQKGYSYILESSGNILVKPEDREYFGYNIFQSMRSFGGGEAEIAAIENDFRDGVSGSRYLNFDGKRWLIQYCPNELSGAVIAVLVPVSITSERTYYATTLLLFCAGATLAILMGMVSILLYQNGPMARKRRRAAEEAELLLRTAQAKNDFLAKMSHDIRTPLNGIIGMNYLSSECLDDKDTMRDNIEKIDSSAHYLLDILNDVLDMSKIERGKLSISSTPFSLNGLIENINYMFAMQARDKGIDFQVELPRAFVSNYVGDQLRINQILANLLSNAIKFTPENGKVTVTVSYEAEDEQRDRITFMVADTGVGMSETYLKNLFTPFEQESAEVAQNYGGSGLGLSIVKNLTDLMGGTITAQSKKNVGSQFTVRITLPRCEMQAEEDAAAVQPDCPVSLEGKYVLLVEDHPINAQIAQRVLQKQGMVVEIAENGKLGLEAFLASEPGHYSIILMDIRMPEMDGYEATRQIRASRHPDAQKIPICAMSANAFDDDVQESLTAGMNDHLKKPIEVPILVATLQKLIYEV